MRDLEFNGRQPPENPMRYDRIRQKYTKITKVFFFLGIAMAIPIILTVSEEPSSLLFSCSLILYGIGCAMMGGGIMWQQYDIRLLQADIDEIDALNAWRKIMSQK